MLYPCVTHVWMQKKLFIDISYHLRVWRYQHPGFNGSEYSRTKQQLSKRRDKNIGVDKAKNQISTTPWMNSVMSSESAFSFNSTYYEDSHVDKVNSWLDNQTRHCVLFWTRLPCNKRANDSLFCIAPPPPLHLDGSLATWQLEKGKKENPKLVQ